MEEAVSVHLGKNYFKAKLLRVGESTYFAMMICCVIVFWIYTPFSFKDRNMVLEMLQGSREAVAIPAECPAVGQMRHELITVSQFSFAMRKKNNLEP